MKDRVARSAGIIALGNVTSRLLGLVRDQITAGLFGRSGATDAFFVASNISQVFYDLLIQGAVSSALVPVFAGYAGETTRHRLWRLASLVINLVIVILLVVMLLLALGAPVVVRLAGAGFGPEVERTAVRLTRVTLFAVVFLGASAVLTALLQSLQDFVFPAFCAALFNACIIVSALLLHGQLHVASLAVGMLVGALAQVLFQLPPLLRRRMRYSLTVSLRDPDLRRIILLYAPVAAGLVISGAQVFIDRNLASRTGEGSISAMQFATRLIQFPLGLIPTAIAAASLPSLSQQADDRDTFVQTLGMGLRLITFLILPAATGLAMLARPIIAVLFQHGAFGPEDTRLTALALLLYLPGLPAAAVDQMLIFAFYARKNTVTPVLIGVAAIGVYLVVALMLITPLGMAGLVLANSAQWLFHAVTTFLLLRRALGTSPGSSLGSTFRLTCLACGLMAAAMWTTSNLLQPHLAVGSTLGDATLILTGGVCGVIVFAATSLVLRMDEPRVLLRLRSRS